MSTAPRRGRLITTAGVGVILLAATPMLAGCSEVVFAVARGMVQAEKGPTAAPGDDDPASHLQVSVSGLEVGDCFDEPEPDESTPEWSSAVYPVSCDDPHMFELYANTDIPESLLPAGEYPGDEAVWDAADSVCYSALEDYVGEAYEDSFLEFWSYIPTEASWKYDDRRVLCVVFDEDGMLTGSAEGSGAESS